MCSSHIFAPDDTDANQLYSFSQAVWHGDTLYCSGQIGTGSDGELSTDMHEQFEQAWKNTSELLTRCGLTWSEVVDITTYHLRLQETLEAFAALKRQYVKEPFPTWTAVGVAELGHPNALVEIRVIARKAVF